MVDIIGWIGLGIAIGIGISQGIDKLKEKAENKIDKVVATIQVDKETNETIVLKSENK
mgnify:CR=1 FL=1|tara:strand:- start:2130 stop:2303 length:174 start_codon:yes stop_codon:yes gene_type:complete